MALKNSTLQGRAKEGMRFSRQKPTSKMQMAFEGKASAGKKAQHTR